MKKLYCLLTLLLTFFGCTSMDYKKIREEERDNFYSQETQSQKILARYGATLSLEEALEIGEARNISIKIKELQYEISKLDKSIAFSNFLPKVNAFISYNQLNQPIYGQVVGSNLPFDVDLETRIVDKNFYTGGLGATLPIFTPTAWYLYEARKKGIDIAGELKDFERKSVRVQIINAYYHILALQSERKFLVQDRREGEMLVKNSKSSLEAEIILPWEYERSKQYLKSKEYALARNERDTKEAKMKLMELLNLYPLSQFDVVEVREMPPVDLKLEDVIYGALMNNSMLKVGDMGHGVEKDKVKMAIAAFLPNIALTGGYVRNNNTAVTDPSVIVGSISGALNIFNGFENINNYRKSKKEEEISDLKREESSVKVILETVNAFDLTEVAKETADLTSGNYRVMDGKLRQKKMERQEGIINDAQYLAVLGEHEKAYSQMKNAYYKYQTTLAVLELVTGGYDEEK